MEKSDPKKPMDISEDELEHLMEEESRRERKVHELGCMGKDVIIKEERR